MRKLLFAAVLMLFLGGTLAAFELRPRIFPADTEVTLRFKAESKWAKDWLAYAGKMQKEGKAKFRAEREYPLVGYWREDHRYSGSDAFKSHGFPEPLDFKIEGDQLVVNIKLRSANVHTFCFHYLPVVKGKRNFRTIKVMTVDQETFKLRPFKGNLHQHSTASDGRLDPAEHVAYARVAGFDFVGISDHNEYKQNGVAIKTAADSKSGLAVYPAEELHTPSAILHGLSIGAAKAHSFRRSRTPEWLKEVQPVYDELAKRFPKVERNQLLPWAESLLLARRAKADGALVVYCHPAWRLRFYLNNTFEMMDLMMRSKEFDAIEIINGRMTRNSCRRENMESIALYHQICVETGVSKPVMSSSDSHNVASPSYRGSYNVIFAPDCTFPSFKAAFLDGRAVAVSDISEIEKSRKPMNFGKLKYVRYANFLDEIGYWRKHDFYAKKQGELILKYLGGDKAAVAEIAKLAARIDRYRESFYYRPAK